MPFPEEPTPPPVHERAAHPALRGFQEPVRAWFAGSFQSPTRAQELAWPVIQSGRSALILAPTGSGKTLAAFLAAIDRLMFEPRPNKKERCRVLYVSPLKALAVDVERNLRAPLVGVCRCAERMGRPFHLPGVAIRTGDTPAKERAQFSRSPSDILITTPESLYLMLTSGARDALRSVRCVIVDEIHTMVSTKRGAHLAVSLERLQELVECPFQRIGLSATVRPVDEAARFLGGLAGPSPGESAPDLSHFPGLPVSHSPTLLPSAAPSIPGAHPRPVTVVDAGQAKQLDLTVEVPVEDMARLGEVVEIPSGPAAQGERRTSIWPSMHPLILELIRRHRSTLIFVNSRRLAERLAAALNELAGEELVRAHHGSIAREQRLHMEDELKAGRLPAMVATSSLELGIDMGAIDLVIQVEAPPTVASAIQRIGRAGHHIGVPSKGVILPKFRGDLLACAALTDRMQAGQVEPMRFPRSPLDVLAQHVVAMVGMEDWGVDALYDVIRRAAPFAELPRSLFDGVLDMLSGRYPSDDFAELRPRLTWDRLAGTLHSREGARRVAIANSGTIPDRGAFGVFLLGGDEDRRSSLSSTRVGELDEEMVFESHAGDTFVLGASTWKIEEITHDRVLVSPAPGRPGRMPFWHGDSAGRPLEFGRGIGALCRTLREIDRDDARRLLQEKHALTDVAARNLLQYLDDQADATGAVPDDRTIVIERYMDDMGDWRVCILSPFGSKVHAPWAMAIGGMIRERTDLETDILWTDDGIVVRFPEADEPPPVEAVIPEPDEVEGLVVRQLGVGGGGARQAGLGAPATAMFASRFREAAARALLLPRRRPGQRTPLWQQRKRAADLLHATAHYGSFPIILETYREIMRDIFDMPALGELLGEIRRRTVRVVPITTRHPSPFASALLFSYVANFIYEGDAPLAERRAQALTVDQSQLRELLGEGELRELLDPEALAELERQIQHLTPERKARHADALHDLLLRLGDLTAEEILQRSAGVPARMEEDIVRSAGAPAPEAFGVPARMEEDTVRSAGAPAPEAFGVPARTEEHADEDVRAPKEWISTLERQRRIVRLPIAGRQRCIAAEDMGRYRDALGIPPPPGLPAAFLEFVRDPLGDLIARYARTHGPFTEHDLAARLGIGIGPINAVLRQMEASGRVLRGEFRPGGAGQEWCDAGVLRSLRQKSLARMRQEVEAVEQPVLGRLYLAWQGILPRRRGREALIEAIEQLQGAAVPACDLETRVLPARVEGYDPHDLDELTASGQVLWAGREPLGERDGRVALYLAEHAALLYGPPRPEDLPDGPVHERIRAHLRARGACFFQQILPACPGTLQREVEAALWDLVWSGEVTNDTLQPLRAFADPRRRPRGAPFRESRLRTRALLPPETSGRWSLVEALLYAAPTQTERLAARARQLLDRYGVLTREAVHSEGIEGGFSAVYPVLKAMEESGRARRGYFVSRLGATQFALPGAVDRLRSLRRPEEAPRAAVLAAADPGNPYGAALPWPEREEGRRPSRSAGAIVILVDGALAAWMGRAERHLLTFFDQAPDREPADTADAVARALAEQVGAAGRRAVFVKQVDGRSAQDTIMAGALADAGFTFGLHGYMRRV